MTAQEWLESDNPTEMVEALVDPYGQGFEGLLARNYREVAWRDLVVVWGSISDCLWFHSHSVDGPLDEALTHTAQCSVHQRKPSFARNVIVFPPGVKAALCRCIIGNPFRRVDCGWRSVPYHSASTEALSKGASEESLWHGDWLPTRDVLRMAGRIYLRNHWHEMPVLADALEEAGCEIDHLITHCREPGPHTRGCWVVDLLMGRHHE